MATVITTLAQLQSACSSGGEYELGADITVSSGLTVTASNFTLDLKTYTITNTSTDYTFTLDKYPVFVLRGTTGKIVCKYGIYLKKGYTSSWNYSCFKMYGGSIIASSPNTGTGVYIDGFAYDAALRYPFEMHDGTISGFNYGVDFGDWWDGPV